MLLSPSVTLVHQFKKIVISFKHLGVLGDLNLNWVIHRSLLFTGPKWWCMMKIKLAGHCFFACFFWQSIQWLINALINGAWKAKKASVTSVGRLKWSNCSGGYSSAQKKRVAVDLYCSDFCVSSLCHENAAKAHSYLMRWEPFLSLAVFTKQWGEKQQRQITSANLLFMQTPVSL